MINLKSIFYSDNYMGEEDLTLLTYLYLISIVSYR